MDTRLFHIHILDSIWSPTGWDNMRTRRLFSRQQSSVCHRHPAETIIDTVHSLGCKELLSLILEKRQLLCLVFEITQADTQESDRLFQLNGVKDAKSSTVDLIAEVDVVLQGGLPATIPLDHNP